MDLEAGGREGWDMVVESQVLDSRDALGDVPGKAGFEELDFNQAARVEASTGHASAAVSGSFGMVGGCLVVLKGEDIFFEMDDGLFMWSRMIALDWLSWNCTSPFL